MTLLRQLILVIVTLFFLLFAGTFAINVKNTRDYLNNQLKTISQDMATSLGLSLSPHMATNEMIVVESLVNAVADSGYYREVVVSDVQGQPLIERIQPVKVDKVPAWFVELIPIDTPKGEALIMGGWTQAGTIRISASPGFAYATLWSTSIEAFFWFLGSSVIVLLLGVVALHYVLRPLRAVETQARAICNREYPVQPRLPWTLELRSVVEAMNRMSIKVREMFDEQAAAMERIRAETYKDQLTGLANRRYFDMQLRNLIESGDSFDTGAVLFIELAEFKRFNDQRGFQAGDKILREVGALMTRTIEETPGLDCFAARLAGANFAAVAADLSEADAREFAGRLGVGLAELHAREMPDVKELGHIGVAVYRGQTLGQLLSEADMALRAAQVAGPHAVHMHDPQTIDQFGAYSATRWLELLRDIIDQRKVVLMRQPAVATQSAETILHHEILLRIHADDGKLMPAGIFMPMARRLGLITEFDKLVIEQVIARLTANPEVKVAINLFPASIRDGAFIDWVCDTLRQRPTLANRIAFEMTDYGAMQDIDGLHNWIRRVAEVGAKTGIDHFGKGFTSFSYLSTLKLDYLKIDGSFIRGIHENRDNQLFVDSLVKIAHGLDIQVIAESVENAEEWATLKALRVDGAQGYGVQRPAQWDV